MVKVLAWGARQVINEMPFGEAVLSLGDEIFKVYEAKKGNDKIAGLFTERLRQVLATVEELCESDFEQESPAFQNLVDVLVNARASQHKWNTTKSAKKMLTATKYKDLFRDCKSRLLQLAPIRLYFGPSALSAPSSFGFFKQYIPHISCALLREFLVIEPRPREARSLRARPHSQPRREGLRGGKEAPPRAQSDGTVRKH